MKSGQGAVILSITMVKRTTQVVAVSVPPESAEDFERIARDEGRNKSELFREMLRVYRAYRETGVFEALQSLCLTLGVEPDPEALAMVPVSHRS